AEVAYLKVPYFSTLDWAGYIRELAEVYHKSFEVFVTNITVVPDAKAQFRVKFRMESPIELTQEIFEALTAKADQAAREIAFPYPKFEEAPAPIKPQRRPAPRAAAP